MTSAPGTNAPGGHPSPRVIAVAINPQASFGRHRGVGAQVVAALEAAGHRVHVLAQENYELLRRETEAIRSLNGIRSGRLRETAIASGGGA